MLTESMELFKKNPTHSNAKLFLKKVKELALSYFQEKYGEANTMPVIGSLFIEVYKASFPECDAEDEFVERLKDIVNKYKDLKECSADFQNDMKTCIDKLYAKKCCV